MSQTLSPTCSNNIAGRDKYRAAKRRYREAIWNGETYRVQSNNAREEGVYANLVSPSGSPKFDLMKCARLVVACVDGNGKRIYADDELNVVGELESELVNVLFRLTLDLAAPSMEDAEKNC